MNNSSSDRYERIPAWLRDLAFVTDFFSWLFALCSRLAEPLMLLCTLSIVAEAGVPALALPALHTLAIGIMICAPEIILPGSFVVAARAQEHARLLFAVCWCFVGLTLLTLISLFVWHFTGASLAWLMCARCAAAVGYSILMRVMSHGHDQTRVISSTSVLTNFAELTERLHGIETNTEQRLAETERRITERFTETLQAFIERIERTSNEQHATPELAFMTETLQGLPALFDRLTQSTHLQLRQVMQEVKTTVEANTSRPKLAIVEASPKCETNTETNEFEKGTFVRSCLTENPGIRNSEIQRKARELGYPISPGYISDIRKAFLEEQTA